MSEMSDAERLADIAQPGLKLWNEVEETDVRYVKSFDRGSFKGTAVDAIYNVKRSRRSWARSASPGAGRSRASGSTPSAWARTSR